MMPQALKEGLRNKNVFITSTPTVSLMKYKLKMVPSEHICEKSIYELKTLIEEFEKHSIPFELTYFKEDIGTSSKSKGEK
jgi:hypothetical protein